MIALRAILPPRSSTPRCRRWSPRYGKRSSADTGDKIAPLAPVLLQENRQIERATKAEPVPAHARGIRQRHVGKALEQHRQQDGANGSPRQVRARAMMRAVAEGLV